MGGVSFFQLSPIIRCHHRRNHSPGESPTWKELVCRNPSGHHYLPPGGRSGVGGVYFAECPLCDFHLLFFVIVIALIVVVNRLYGRYWYVVIPLGTIICLLSGGSQTCVECNLQSVLCVNLPYFSSSSFSRS